MCKEHVNQIQREYKMACSGEKRAKHESKNLQSAEKDKQKKITNAKEFVMGLYAALSKTDGTIAPSLLKEPFVLKTVMDSHTERYNFPSALHALVVALAFEDNDMESILYDIHTRIKWKDLCEALEKARKVKKLGATEIKKLEERLRQLAGCSGGENVVAAINSLPSNADQEKAKTIYLRIETARLWDEALEELAKLSNAMDSFDPKAYAEKQKAEQLAKENGVVYDPNKHILMSALAEMFGCDIYQLYDKKNKILKKNPEAVRFFEVEARRPGAKGSQRLLFVFEHFDAFKKMFEAVDNKAKAGKAKVVEKKTQSVKAAPKAKKSVAVKTKSKAVKKVKTKPVIDIVEDCKGPATEPVVIPVEDCKGPAVESVKVTPKTSDEDVMIFNPKDVNDYVSLKAIKVRVDRLVKDLEQIARQEPGKKYAEIKDQLRNETDPEKCATLLSDMTAANDLLVKQKRLSDAIAKYQTALSQREHALSELDKSRAALYEFWQNTKQYM